MWFLEELLGVPEFLPPTQSLLVFGARSCGDLSSWHWGPVLGGPSVVLGLLTSEIPLLNFYPPHVDVGPHCSVSALLLSVWVDVGFLIP